MAVQKFPIGVNAFMTEVRDALIESGFFEGCTIDVDIDWSTITTVVTSQPETGDEHTVWVDNGVLKLYKDGSWVVTDTAVTYPDNVNTTTRPTTVRIKDQNGNLLFKVSNDPVFNNAPRGRVKWTSYCLSGSTSGLVGMMSGYYVADYSTYIKTIYVCSNGIIIHVTCNNEPNTKEYNAPIRIVKTNNGKYAFITCRNTADRVSTPTGYPTGSGGYCSLLDCITYDDTNTISTFLITNAYGLHYEVIPMLTNSAPNLLSYTEKSGFLQYSTQDLAIKTVMIGGKRYLTDSFFAILDED